MITLNKWIIVEGSKHFISAENYNTDELYLLKDGYAVTRSAIYKLGDIDPIWTKMPDAGVKIELFS